MPVFILEAAVAQELPLLHQVCFWFNACRFFKPEFLNVFSSFQLRHILSPTIYNKVVKLDRKMIIQFPYHEIWISYEVWTNLKRFYFLNYLQINLFIGEKRSQISSEKPKIFKVKEATWSFGTWKLKFLVSDLALLALWCLLFKFYYFCGFVCSLNIH